MARSTFTFPPPTGIPDPSAEPDDDVLTVVGGVASWEAPTGGGGGGGGGILLGRAVNNTPFTLSTNNTLEDMTGSSITKTTGADKDHVVSMDMLWRNTDANWRHHVLRLLVDGATTGVNQPDRYVWRQNSNGPTDVYSYFHGLWVVTGLSAGSHTFKFQSTDLGGLINREFSWTQMLVWEYDEV